MAFPVASQRENPKFTLVAGYSVGRSGEYPTARFTYEETVFILGESSVVESVVLAPGGALQHLVLPAFADHPEFVGRPLVTPAHDVLGVISGVQTIELVPESQESDGNGGFVTIPAVKTAHVTLATGHVAEAELQALEGEQVAVTQVTTIGNPAYRRAKHGKNWELYLFGKSALADQRMKAMLFQVYFAAVTAFLAEANISMAPTQVQGLLLQLAAKGQNIDTFIAAEAEQLEQDRLAGLVPWLQAFGDAPGTQAE